MSEIALTTSKDRIEINQERVCVWSSLLSNQKDNSKIIIFFNYDRALTSAVVLYDDAL